LRHEKAPAQRPGQINRSNLRRLISGRPFQFLDGRSQRSGNHSIVGANRPHLLDRPGEDWDGGRDTVHVGVELILPFEVLP
jgi:hypothetical protein